MDNNKKARLVTHEIQFMSCTYRHSRHPFTNLENSLCQKSNPHKHHRHVNETLVSNVTLIFQKLPYCPHVFLTVFGSCRGPSHTVLRPFKKGNSDDKEKMKARVVRVYTRIWGGHHELHIQVVDPAFSFYFLFLKLLRLIFVLRKKENNNILYIR